MNDLIADLNQRWAVLESGTAHPGEYRLIGTGASTEAGAVAVAVNPERRRCLIIPLTAAEADAGTGRASTRGIGLEVQTLGNGPTLVLTCRMPHLDRMFTIVAADVIRAVDGETGALTKALAVLRRWRELMERPPAEILSEEATVGLVAELLILTELVRRDPARGLDIWRGPTGERHDFRRGPHALEVKASASRTGRRFRVSGLEQLEPPDDGDLHLVWVRLLRDPGGPLSAPRLISQLRDAGVDVIELEHKLHAMGYSHAHHTEYERRRYALDELLVWAVEGDFPRITANSFRAGPPPGVVEINYTVDISGEHPPALPDAEVERLFAAMTAGGESA